ncbi:hypothetical protein SAMN05660860_00868 [Geoalkalibacter ferrihydriticus]|uniref:Uncharacterized protein n=1 Tax=Geoalkalibacter ferrihydriticus TaxID=392333 RepID=A0A1G9KUH2_9BACT|nr:hypothetical protein [Geoalkalibacter ferrihydriticus]SDL53530.1 hypothetical protein SAMN05660860_00868 [Geoalkalibacter ferrihydriticus]
MTANTDWEARCRRCGRCCFEKIDYEGRIYYTDRPCEKLDLETRLCTVYAQRQTHRPGCTLLTEEIVRLGVLPKDCPYVAGIAGYVAPQLWDEEPSE